MTTINFQVGERRGFVDWKFASTRPCYTVYTLVSVLIRVYRGSLTGRTSPVAMIYCVTVRLTHDFWDRILVLPCMVIFFFM